MDISYLGYNIIDFIVIGIMILFMIEGTVKGFVRSIFGLLSFILSILIAKLLYSDLAVILKTTTNMDENLKVWILERLGGNMGEKVADLSSSQLSSLKIPELLHSDFLVKLHEGNLTESLQIQITQLLSDLMINILAVFIIFFASQIVFWLLEKILNLFTKLPVISQLNRFLGFIFGSLKGVVILYISFALLIPILSFVPQQGITDKINESIIGSELYNNNVVVRFLNTETLFHIEPFENK